MKIIKCVPMLVSAAGYAVSGSEHGATMAALVQNVTGISSGEANVHYLHTKQLFQLEKS